MSKNIIKDSFYYTLLGFLPLSFAVVFTPIYLRYLNEAEYGILSLFMLYTGLMAKIYGVGIPNAFNIFYWDVYKSKLELKKLFSSVLGILLLFQLFFILIGYLFGESFVSFAVKSSDQFTYDPIFITALFFAAFMVYYEMFLYFFRNQGQLKEYATLSISTIVLLTVGTLFGVVVMDMKELGAIWGRTFGYGFVIVGFLLFFLFRYGISIDLKQWRILLVFSFPLFINNLIGAFGYGIDRIIIERMDSIENLGIYGLALIVITVIETWFTALNNALSPTLFRFLKESLKEKAEAIQSIGHAIYLLVTFVIVLILAVLYPVFDLIIPENFHQAAYYIPLLSLGFVWRVLTSLYTYPIYIQKRTKLLLYNQSSNLIFTLLFGYISYQYFGIMGIVMTVYLVKVVEFIIIYFLSKSLFQMPIRLKSYLYLSIFMGTIAGVVTFLNEGSTNQYLLYTLPLVAFLAYVWLFHRPDLRQLSKLYQQRNEIQQT